MLSNFETQYNHVCFFCYDFYNLNSSYDAYLYNSIIPNVPFSYTYTHQCLLSNYNLFFSLAYLWCGTPTSGPKSYWWNRAKWPIDRPHSAAAPQTSVSWACRRCEPRTRWWSRRPWSSPRTEWLLRWCCDSFRQTTWVCPPRHSRDLY